MKVTVTHEFASNEEAAEFLQSLTLAKPMGHNVEVVREPAPSNPAIPPAPQPDGPTEPTRKRKPRADAGKPRGAYKPRETTGAAGGTPAGHQQQEPGASAPAASTTSAPQEPVSAPEAPTGAASVAAAAPATLTLDAVRAKLKELGDIEGQGTPACIAALHAFAVNRVSELKEAQYPDFMKHLQSVIDATK